MRKIRFTGHQIIAVLKSVEAGRTVNTAAAESKESSPENQSGNLHFFSTLHVRNARGNFEMATAGQILSEAMRAINFRHPVGVSFISSEGSSDFFRAKLAGRDREIFAVAFLNNQNQLIGYEELFAGSLSSTQVSPGVIARAALKANAGAVILGHNHLSHHPDLPREDVVITKKIQQALRLVEIRVLDHILVAGNNCISMAAQGVV